MVDRYDLIFLSPHLDDVAVSCPGRILAERAKGKKILVVTVFSGCGDSREAAAQYERRREEDRIAMAALDVDFVWLDFPDAPYRNRFYDWNFERINMDEHPDDRKVVSELGLELSKICADYQPEQIYFPLAVGNHVDHRLVHDAASLMPPSTPIVFYEDRPYSFLRHNVLLRLHQIGAAIVSDLPMFCQLSGRQKYAALFEMLQDMRRQPFYQQFRFYRRTRLFSPLKLRKLFFLPHLLKVVPVLEPEVMSWDSMGSKVLGCIEPYESQKQIINCDLADWEMDVRQYARRIGANGGYVERFWKLVSYSAGE